MFCSYPFFSYLCTVLMQKPAEAGGMLGMTYMGKAFTLRFVLALQSLANFKSYQTAKQR